MPPVPRHENQVTWFLQALVDTHLWMSALDARKNEVIVHNGLIVLAFVDEVFPLDDPARLLWLEEHPMLNAVRHCIPGCSAERVCVHRCARALGTDAKPTKWRPRVPVHQRQQIMREEIRHLEVVYQLTDGRIVFHARLKEIQWAVVPLGSEVVGIILKLRPEFLTLVVFRHLERCVPKPLLHGIHVPPRHCRPVVRHALDDDWSGLAGVVLLEPFWSDVAAFDSWDRHRLFVVDDGSVQHLVPVGITEFRPVTRLDVRTPPLLAPPNLSIRAPAPVDTPILVTPALATWLLSLWWTRLR
mmetsp:Transcript_51082/g.136273  ORF Transcript_51082/g.136273 Transcript_51082/m.136273 type:complete len:300 (-) Transcript_51082:230-1129(-)